MFTRYELFSDEVALRSHTATVGRASQFSHAATSSSDYTTADIQSTANVPRKYQAKRQRMNTLRNNGGEGGPHRRQEWYESQRDSKPQKRPNLIQYESTSKLMSQPMNTPNLKPTRAPKSLAAALLLAVVLAASPATHAAPQHTTAIQPDDTAPHRPRLIL